MKQWLVVLPMDLLACSAVRMQMFFISPEQICSSFVSSGLPACRVELVTESSCERSARQLCVHGFGEGDTGSSHSTGLPALGS